MPYDNRVASIPIKTRRRYEAGTRLTRMTASRLRPSAERQRSVGRMGRCRIGIISRGLAHRSLERCNLVRSRRLCCYCCFATVCCLRNPAPYFSAAGCAQRHARLADELRSHSCRSSSLASSTRSLTRKPNAEEGGLPCREIGSLLGAASDAGPTKRLRRRRRRRPPPLPQ